MPFNSIFAWVIKKRLHQIELFRKYPENVQHELFEKLIENGSQSEFGRKYNFSQITSYEDFSKSVPLNNYDTLKPWVERLMQGEQNMLWSHDTKWFAKSSGTTSDRSKFIPVTKESLEDCHYKGGKDLLALYYENFPNRKLYKGKHLIIGGSAQILPVSHDMYQGDLSAIIVKNLPWWAEMRRTPSKEIALMTEWEEKIEKMARSTIEEDVYIIAGVPSWTLVLARKILEITGKKNLREVWPNLELFMHGGVSFEPYREAFRELIPFDDMHYVETYNASEGFFGIQDVDGSNELLLMLDYGIFYEFIPMDRFEDTDSKTVLKLDQVELDTEYALVISTNAGLWRYIMGDTIRFTSKTPYRFRLTGRTKHFINAFGEEVIVNNTDFAIKEACSKTNAIIREYTVAPIYMDGKTQGKHEWLIEFDREPNDLNRFMYLLDESLRAINSDYDAKRTKNLALGKPVLHVLSSGSFEAWLQKKGKLGGQHKVPRLMNSREIVEQILQETSYKTVQYV
ncbi:GH3 auxin-responsive promoter family protein [Fluviicola taffensis]|uniref:GH3 auxin-responsive promoter n=1 Tax=Fluviicola taffensis (strain DSM 16823 / NCIMB 13979 / RW262) TaxID=755732 RepID=F2I9P2_FLUTR|nr:GH3 auxin-responsive promoter family protein [Fluviicola taffensis]AEA43038.1 GH3 auxin-responsive promoter [Fluviicola taffensis DSM 16823]